MRSRFTSAAIVAAMFLAMPGFTGSAFAVSTADEICAPAADPCVISGSFQVDSGSLLDFGLRALQFTGGGQLDLNAGTATVLCGSVTTNDNTTQVFKVRGTSGLGSVDGGFLNVEVRRGCSGDTARPCIADNNCNLGTCSAMSCSGQQSRNCSVNGDCQLGTCDSNQCSNAPSVGCVSDGDCNLGTCSLSVCSFDSSMLCGSDGDCNFGTCSAGDGSMTLNRKVRADGGADGDSGTIVMRTAGDMIINKEIDVHSNNLDGDGGTIELESGEGSVVINATLNAAGGGRSTGGEICILAGEDFIGNGNVEAVGGDFDGGFIEIDVERDAIINSDLNANSSSGEGFGGEITVFTGRHLTFNGDGAHTTNGHMSDELFGGDAGAQDYTAGGDITIAATVNFQSEGAPPEGFGETLAFTADGDIQMSGDLRATAGGDLGGGGAIELSADGDITIAGTALLDASGGRAGAGEIDVFALTDIVMAGTAEANGGNSGVGGSILFDSGGTLDLDGEIIVNGTDLDGTNGTIDMEACRMNINPTGLLDNRGDFGDNFLIGRERISVLTGGRVLAESTGNNFFTYRSAAKPPAIDGTVSPTPSLTVNEDLTGCPICGNGELEQTETCDDGNLVNGDGCSSDCQDEDCIAQTPGYPAVPLCDDDTGCTRDTCVAGVCQNVVDCDDGVSCTRDACGGDGECVNAPDNSLCDDANVCSIDTCHPFLDCMYADNNVPCDDGADCTVTDVCFMQECRGVTNCPDEQFCNENTGQCVGSTTTTTTSTTSTTLSQQCGDGVVTPPESCDDGDTAWQQGDYCNGSCDELICGDTDDSGALTATDALYVLRVAVSLETCDICICDVDSTSAVTAGDALRLLRNAVGVPDPINCLACPN